MRRASVFVFTVFVSLGFSWVAQGQERELSLIPEIFGTDLDHFKCYKAKSRFPNKVVELVDQFGPATVIVQRPERLCNPVDKNGEGINDPTAHLTCYKAKDKR